MTFRGRRIGLCDFDLDCRIRAVTVRDAVLIWGPGIALAVPFELNALVSV